MRITLDDWIETYEPIKNTITPDAECDGELFETYGPDYAFIKAIAVIDPDRVWTYCDDDYGNVCIVSGHHLVNRIGYFITKHGNKTGKELYVDFDVLRDELGNMDCLN